MRATRESHQALSSRQGTSGTRTRALRRLVPLDADQSALQRDFARSNRCWDRWSQALLGTSQRVFGALQIDFFGALAVSARTGYRIRKNFGKSANNGEMADSLHGIVVAEFADPNS